MRTRKFYVENLNNQSEVDRIKVGVVRLHCQNESSLQISFLEFTYVNAWIEY